jgi:hypothetical protein
MDVPSRYFVGLDLGQAHDFTALDILERQQLFPGLPPASYSLRHLQRFERGTSYPAIVKGVRAILARPPLAGSAVYLAVDATGVGRPVCDMIRPVFPAMAAITITGGRDVTEDWDGFCTPKRDLVSVLQVLLQGRRLKIAKGLPEAENLAHELSSFKVKVNVSSGSETFESWRERDHDDLVLAVALAAWLGERAAAEEVNVEDQTAQFTTYYTR